MAQLPLFPLDPLGSAPKKPMNHLERLQQLWDELCPVQERGESRIVYQSYHGWFVVFNEPRYFDDQGDYLGWNHQEAESAIRKIWQR